MKNIIELLPHNEYALNQIVKAYKIGTKNICYTSGVGTGKSYVFMKLVNEYFKDKKILYILPKNAIKENIKDYPEFKLIKDNVDFLTYNYFNDYEKGMLKINEYDLVVVDECHHLGSAIYGNILKRCMNDSIIPFLGLTATPIREDGKDILSYFNKTIKGMTTIDAIKNGYMKPFNYRICLPSDKQELYSLLNDITQNNNFASFGDGLHKVKNHIDYEMSENTLRDIIKQYPRNKWTIFCDNIKNLNQHLPLIHRIFSDYNIYPLHFKLEEENYLKNTINGVNASEKAVVVCCDMFLEGMHMNNMDGIIFFRNVQSLPLFQQMLGRVCRMGKEESPVVIDCTSCGPKILFEMINMNDILDDNKLNNTDKITLIKKNISLIMNLGLDEHKEWEGFNDFLTEIVNAKQKKIYDIDNVKNAAKEYFRMCGVIKNTDKLLKNCADLWDISPNILKNYIIQNNKEEVNER